MRITPQFSYLPYNLGLVYQRLNRRREAEAEYRKAMALCARFRGAAQRARFAESVRRQSCRSRKVLSRLRSQRMPICFAARHNLAVLLAESKDRQTEAIDLYKQNLAARRTICRPASAWPNCSAQRAAIRPGLSSNTYAWSAQTPEYLAARLALGRFVSESEPGRSGA